MSEHRSQAYVFRRYMWLYETLWTSGGATFETINDLWQRSSLGDGSPLPHKTFENHRRAVEELFDVEIVCDRATNEYSIKAAESETWLHEMMSSAIMLKNLMSSSDLERYVHLEKIYGGNEFLQTIIKALTDKRELTLSYRHNYDSTKEEELTVKPVGIKLFRQRWYLIAEKPDGKHYSYSLDRIMDVACGENVRPSKLSIEKLFADSFGIIVEAGTDAEEIVLKVEREQANYFKSLPLHRSQRVVDEDCDFVTFRLKVAPTYDFIMEILSHGPRVEVLAPESVREKVARRIEEMAGLYRK